MAFRSPSTRVTCWLAKAIDCSRPAAPPATCAPSSSGSPPPDIASSVSDRARSSPGCAVRQPLATDQALDIFRRKTSPAFQVALGIGAALAGATAETQQVLRDYSEALGIAYQIRDDLEDLADTEPVGGSRRRRTVAAAGARLRQDQGLGPRSGDGALARRAAPVRRR